MPPQGRRRVTPEHLVELIVDNERRLRERRGLPSLRFRRSQRIWIEPFFNFIGYFVGQLIELLPAPWAARAHLWICQKLQGHAPEKNPQLSERITQSVALARSLYQQTGQWPAVLIGTSHPETLGDTAWIRFELMRQGLEVANALIAASPAGHARRPPQCFLAIDPFALESVPPAVQGLYSGIMHSQYLVWDRQASTQSWIQRRLLLRGTGLDLVAWRLLRALKRTPVIMAIGGGIPDNARLLYAARESISGFKLKLWPMTRREAQHRLMSLLGNAWNADLEMRILNLYRELGLHGEDAQRVLRQLQKNMALEVPARPRLWQVINARLVQKGIPVIAIPITHRTASPHVVAGVPVGLSHSPGDIQTWSEDFANQFVSNA